MVTHHCIWDLICHGGASHSEATAVVSCHEPPDYLRNLTISRPAEEVPPEEKDCLLWSYIQLLVACQRVSRILATQGIRRGDRVATFLGKGIESAIIAWVAVNLQLTLVPLAEGAFISDQKDEMTEFVSSLNCKCLVTTPELHVDVLHIWLVGQGFDMDILTLQTMDSICLEICDPENPEAHDIDVFPRDPSLEDGGDRVALICCMKDNINRRPKGNPVRAASLTPNLLVNGFRSKSSGEGRTLITVTNCRTGWWTDAILTWTHGGGVVFPPAGLDDKSHLAILEHFGGP